MRTEIIAEIGQNHNGDMALATELIHAAKAAEFSFHAVEVAVVIGVARHEAIAIDVIVALDPLDHVHWKWQSREPRCTRELVGNVEPRRRCSAQVMKMKIAVFQTSPVLCAIKTRVPLDAKAAPCCWSEQSSLSWVCATATRADRRHC